MPIPARSALLAFACWLVVSPSVGLACSTFFCCRDGAMMVGRNYDWHLEEARVLVNPRGVQKRAFSFEKPAEWTSRYASVTFNQYGREFPCDGMNQAGLVVTVMWLNKTGYPAVDKRPTVTSLQWVQQQLDTAATVKQVLANCPKTRVVSLGAAYVHYLVADASGDCATIDFIDGRMVVHHGKQLPYGALTNTAYADAVEFLDDHQGFGGTRKPPSSRMSVDRFIRCANAVRLAKIDKTPLTSRTMFSTLKNVSQGDFTKWSICYDVAGRAVEFHTKNAPEVKRIELAKLKLNHLEHPLSVDISVRQPGDITQHLVEHTPKENLRLMNAAFDGTYFLKSWPKAARNMLANYPYLTFKTAAADPKPDAPEPQATLLPLSP